MSWKSLNFIFFLFFYWNVFHLQATSSQLDSLEQAIEQFGIDTFSSNYISLIHDYAYAHEQKGGYQKAVNTCKRGISLAQQGHVDDLHFRLLLLKGKCSYFLSNYEDAKAIYSTALSMKGDFIIAKDSARIFSQLGFVMHHLGHLEKAHAYQMKALEIYERLDDPYLISQYYYAVGLIFVEQKKFKDALENYKKSLALYRSSGATNDISDWYAVIGEVYHEMDSLDQALFYKKEAFRLDSVQDYEYGLGYGYYSLGLTYTKLQELDKAMQLHEKGYQIRKEIGDKEEQAKSLTAIGELHVQFKKYDLAKTQFQEALKIAQEIKAKPLIKDIYHQLSKACYKRGDYKNAYVFQQKHFFLRDSITNENSLQNIANLKSKHQVDQQQQQIALLKKEQEISELYRNLAIIGILLLLSFMIYRLWRFKEQANYNKILKVKNQEIKKQNLQLQSANEDLEQFAYISSHDLKAPLRIIGSYANLLNRRYKSQLDETGVEFLDFITNGVKQMNTLLEDVYAYTRLEKEALEFKPVELNLIVEKIKLSLGYTIQEKNAVIKADDLPNIYGNSTMLSQVFQNLIDNGMKFMAEGESPHIKVSSIQKDEHIQICIQDNGIGIAEIYHDKIFTVFRRLHNDTEYKGTGVGLAICKKIIEKHGGNIWVESDGVHGSCFCFTLPAIAQKQNNIEEKEMNFELMS